LGVSKKLLDYFNRKKSKSSDKNHTRYRNDICNHWDLDYVSVEQLEELLKQDDVETTIKRTKKDDNDWMPG
tara:strand:- start:1506 stop:1718 length:213 start_codon:yes stop_codon:yes gene_type:complete